MEQNSADDARHAMTRKRRIAIFGGSFNPVHNGHTGLLRRAFDEFGLDAAIVIPAATSPFKKETRQLPGELRLEMARAAFAGMPGVTIDGREIERGGVSYAIDTVRQIAAENRDAELIFLAGEDAIADVDKWKDSEELRRLCTFRALPRTEESSTEARRRIAAGEPAGRFMPEAAAKLLDEYLKKRTSAKT